MAKAVVVGKGSELAPGWERVARETSAVLDEMCRERGLDPDALRRQVRQEIDLYERSRREVLR